jgi:hypothetical protein
MPERDTKQLNKNALEPSSNGSDSAASSEAERKRAKRMVTINNFFSVYFKFIILIVVLLIFVASYIYILKPKYDKAVEAVKGNIVSQERVYLQQLNKLNNFKQLVAVYSKIPSDEKDKLNNLLPPDYIKEQLFIELGYIIPQNGHNLTYLDFQKDKEIESEQEDQRRVNTEEELFALSFLDELPPDIGYINAEIRVANSTYNGVKNILKLLENNLRLIDVYEISFSPEDEVLELSFVTYYLDEKK